MGKYYLHRKRISATDNPGTALARTRGASQPYFTARGLRLSAPPPLSPSLSPSPLPGRRMPASARKRRWIVTAGPVSSKRHLQEEAAFAG
jgi:hypothetical protein